MIKALAIAAVVSTAAISAAHAQSITVPTNESVISQIGDYNAATVKQIGGGGNTQTTIQGAGDASALSGLPNSDLLTLGPSFNNIANTTQLANPANGGSNSSITIQLGAGSNVSNVMQVALAGGTNTQLTIQNGFANIASTTQISSAGLNNKSTIMQTGSHNTATVAQK
jgi:hypothetical protein